MASRLRVLFILLTFQVVIVSDNYRRVLARLATLFSARRCHRLLYCYAISCVVDAIRHEILCVSTYDIFGEVLLCRGQLTDILVWRRLTAIILPLLESQLSLRTLPTIVTVSTLN